MSEHVHEVSQQRLSRSGLLLPSGKPAIASLVGKIRPMRDRAFQPTDSRNTKLRRLACLYLREGGLISSYRYNTYVQHIYTLSTTKEGAQVDQMPHRGEALQGFRVPLPCRGCRCLWHSCPVAVGNPLWNSFQPGLCIGLRIASYQGYSSHPLQPSAKGSPENIPASLSPISPQINSPPRC